MSSKDKFVMQADLRGSEQHFPLKDDSGREGDPDHTQTDAKMSDDMAKKVCKSDADTQIADALRDMADER